MKHRFYQKSKAEQNRIQLKIGSVALIFNLLVLGVSIVSGIYLFIVLSIMISLSVIAPFFDVPALKKQGKLIYYSSLFIAEKEDKGVIKIHGGSLFDYVFVIDKSLNGTKRTHFILQKYLEGLLNLMRKYEDNYSTSVKIKGTSYILNARTAEKIGLEIIRVDAVQKLILIFNYFNILISNSIAKDGVSFPRLNNIKTFEGSIEELIKRRPYIEALNEKLKRSVLENN